MDSAAAEAVAGDITAVTNALDEAVNASDRAETAKNEAVVNIEIAENKISEVSEVARRTLL